MKRGFTLIELLIVVVVIAALTTIVFRLAGVGGDATARATTVSRLQRIENALSGYYAAFGTYPPVPLQGSRDIYQEVDAYHGVQLDDVNKQTISGKSDKNAMHTRDQILAACRSQPFGAYFPFKNGKSEYVETISKAIKKLVNSGARQFKGLSDERKTSLLQGFTDGVSGNSMVGSLSTSKSSWWGDDSVQLWRYGVMSFLLPRYLFMMQQDQEFQVEDYAQWTAYNDLPFDPDTGVLYGNGDVRQGWRTVRDNYSKNSGRDRWKIELIPSQAACARWMPNFERICATTFDEWEFWGTRIKGKQEYDHHLDVYSTPVLYSPAGRQSTSQQYVLDCITVKDGWGREFFYYSPPPHQTYRVWSSGADGMTFPPWTDLNTLNESERKVVLNWTKDDISVMKN
jgi:prepilin-type N-terminal cleavage/methylation domain-containing protein